MNHSRAGKWARLAVWGGLLVIATMGCSPLQTIGFIFGRDDKVPAAHPLAFEKDGPKKNKDELVIALLPRVAPGTGTQFVNAPSELADKLAKQLTDLAKESKDKRKVKVLSQTQVDKFKIANRNWNKMDTGEIGEKLGADFVLDIWLDKLNLFQPGSLNQIYEGRADVQVTVYEIGTNGGEKKDKYSLAFSYPRGTPRSVDTMPESKFKELFIENLGQEIANMHFEHKASDSIADGH